jgi:hypothetical protein
MLELAAKSPAGGCFVEVGVYKGGAAWHLAQLARRQRRQLHLFDTFTGIPEALPDDTHKVGDFADTAYDMVKELIPDAVFHVGIFPNTLPLHMPPIAFAHIDCDQYMSTHAAIARLPMTVGGIMLFDDYRCTWGATRAVDEAFGNRIHLTKQDKAYVVL